MASAAHKSRRHLLSRVETIAAVALIVLGSVALIAMALLWLQTAQAAVLPEDRADVLYHSYDGDNVTVDGPSVLVRKGFGQKLSISANHYVDSVSSASVDVLSTASAYSEERTQNSLGVDFLHGKTLMNLSHTVSDENDYEAATTHFSVSQDIFGDLTTVSLGYARGNDTVMRNGDADFEQKIDRQTYILGLTQILTKNMILGFSWETITDEGFLNNPYRTVRFLSDTPRGYSFESEVYPNTRTSNAAALRARYFLPFRAALSAQYRYFTDTWDIEAHTVELGYTHPLKRVPLTLDFGLRHYSQTAAEFYSDLFAREQQFNFRARDKELSTFNSQAISIGASYEFAKNGWGFIDKGSINLIIDHFIFEYEDFRDLTVDGATVAQEPLFELDANVIQLYLSLFY